MRINLQVQIIGDKRVLPINYQYEFSSWIYKTFHFGNAEFANFLHSRGYFDKHRQFKLFTFSNLQFEGRNAYKVSKDRLILNANTCKMQLATILPDALKYFIDGLFAQQEFEIGDKRSSVQFKVQQVNIESLEQLSTSVKFKASSPICVAVKEKYNDKEEAQYKSPEDDSYWELVKNNLLNKWRIIKKLDLIEEDHENSDWHFELLSKKVRSRLVHLKVNTEQHTKVRGFLYDFEMTAPKHIIQTAYLCGLGEKNSQGFGCLSIMNK